MGERVHKSVLNAEVNLLFYFLSLFLTFFSRKIFLDNLGAEFMGLTGTLNNILGYLNLSELGISACIGYFLFKPIQTGNRREIQDILSLLGYLYRWIGGIILGGAFIISLFFPLIFSSANLSLPIIYFAFYSFLGSSLIGYFINYRQILLSADQKNYLVAIYYQSARLVKLALQIYLAYTYKNLYVWVAIEFLFAILGCIILNWKINKEYPWLKVDTRQGRQLLKQYPEIITKTKQVFIHKIKDFVLVKSDELFIFLFVSLKMVAFYGNYMIIISKLISLFSSITGSVGASVGNLVAEGNKPHMLRVFWEYTTIQHTIAATLAFSLYTLMEPFIAHWVGAEYIMDHRILILLVVYIYITNSRNSVDSFNYAHGLYADVWAAWAELIINVSVTIICGLLWGIIGILLGKITSLLAIVVLWKPYYLFTAGFKESVSLYWKGVLRNYAISAFAIGAALYTIRFIPFNPYHDIWQWVAYSAVSMIIFFCYDITATLLFAKGAKDSLQRIKNIRKK
ncbi:Membrane protein involved in the export of O-antigen and teichoic acid [Prevotellaceae bacterium HUN156]|jgi:O-antigen/teichoic acid export membrane protein|nr:Membrane protein involved in the export of O-antigen and teichoic acid [Prevotellaceae bacterium HUN156]